LNKVLFVSLLVLGLCILQPALGDERLAKRIAGGFQATQGQFPFVALIEYTYTTTSGTFTYQGTGTIYNPQIVITTGNAMALCKDGTAATVYQGVVDVNNQGTPQIISFTCQLGVTIIRPSGWAAGVYDNDLSYINLAPTGLSFSGNVFLRLPSSSPTQADIGRLFAAGYGETSPGGAPSPVLEYVQINPQRNRVCNERAVVDSLTNSFSFSENFCVSGYLVSPTTGLLTDVCQLDAGSPIIRTQDINNPYADFEVVGIVNFGSCADTTPAFATYIFKYVDSGFLPSQTNPPTVATPPNPRAFDGNFACGDGVVQGAYEKCDPPIKTSCCNQWTCQLLPTSTPCTLNNRNGTRCRQQPRCNKFGNCKAKNRRQGRTCGGRKTKCHKGKCCTYVNKVATSCV